MMRMGMHSSSTSIVTYSWESTFTYGVDQLGDRWMGLFFFSCR